MKLTVRALLSITLLSVCFGASAATSGEGKGKSTYTKSSSHSDSFIDTTETVQVQTWSIQLLAVLDGDITVYDRIFDAAFSDPLLQDAVISAQLTLTDAAAPDAVAFGLPILTSLTTTLLSSYAAAPLETSSSSEEIWTLSTAYGPADILIGNFGACTDTGPVFETGLPINCSDGDPQQYRVLAGQINTNINTHTHTDHYRTITTTETYLNRAVYLLAGTTGRIADVPEPGSLVLLVLGACGACLVRRRHGFRAAA